MEEEIKKYLTFVRKAQNMPWFCWLKLTSQLKLQTINTWTYLS